MKDEFTDYRHIWLYSKSHYKKGDTMKDLRTILAHRNGVEQENVNNKFVINVLSKLVCKHLSQTHMEQTMVELMGFGMHNHPVGSCLYTPYKPLMLDEQTRILLNKLAFVTIKNENPELTLNLGKPDSTILPLKDED